MSSRYKVGGVQNFHRLNTDTLEGYKKLIQDMLFCYDKGEYPNEYSVLDKIWHDINTEICCRDVGTPITRPVTKMKSLKSPVKKVFDK